MQFQIVDLGQVNIVMQYIPMQCNARLQQKITKCITQENHQYNTKCITQENHQYNTKCITQENHQSNKNCFSLVIYIWYYTGDFPVQCQL